MQGKKSFMIYKDMKRTVDDLTSDEAGNLFKAILDWQNGESVEKYDRMTRLLLQQMIVHFQREDEAWESKRAANAENGKKGGRPRNPENPVGFSGTHDNPDEPKKAVTVTDTVTVTEEDDTSTASDDADDVWVSKRKRKLSGKRLEAFKRFWEAFDYKRDRASAIDAWIDIPQLTNPLVDKICERAKREAHRRPDLVASGRTPIFAQGWISARRWEDEVEEPKPLVVNGQRQLTERELSRGEFR